MKFSHLHVHSHYSLLDGLPKIDLLLDYVKELGMDSVALTDHGNIYGAVEFYKKAKQRGIKPIIGCEFYTAFEKMEQKRPNIDDKRYHLVILVKDEIGYKNLVQLITKAHLKGFYYKPRIDEQLLEKHSKGLICLSACLQGKIPKLILAEKYKQAEKTALKYQKIFGKENFYLELQDHPNLPEQKKANKELIKMSKKLDIPLVATQDVHYLKPEDAEAQDVLMLINTGADIDNPERKTMKNEDYSMKSPETMIKAFKDVPTAISNTQKIVKDCNFEFKLGQTQLPYFAIPKGKNADDYLKTLSFQGLEERQNRSLQIQEKKRLEYELSVIKKTGFADYFLIIADVVTWAKKQKIIVGPGRGSISGSLIAFALKITDIDPLKYNLLFERFLNLERIAGLPDIDLDFADTRRDEVIEYVAKKYGQDNVAQIITFGTMAARAVIRDVGRALKYPYNYCDKLAKMIPMFTSLNEALTKVEEFKNIYQSDEKARTLIDLAKNLEGVVRHASTHACGVVISKTPLSKLVPLQHPTQNDETIITQYDMHSVEALGLLKMDFLGLKNLTIIEKTLRLIKVIQNKEIDIVNIPLNNKKTYELLQEGQSTSVFQLESDGMKRYLKQLKPTHFEDIIALLALYRPGPIQFIPDYIKRKHKQKKIEYLHPKLKSILEPTYGIMVYQEQLMQIAQKLAGFSLGEADILRKAVGKKIKKLLLSQKEKFIKGAIKNKIKKQTADKIWEWILPFARYGFNKSHSTAYGMIAYQTAFLKTNYPNEFMAAVLSIEKQDIERIAFLIDECKKMGIEILPPNVNESFKNFTITGEKQIRFGLLAIKNVGHNVVEAIVKERKQKGPFQSIDDFINRIQSKDLNKKSLESLIKVGAFDSLADRNELLHNLEKLLNYSREVQINKTNGQKGLFDGTKHSNGIKLSPTKPATKKEKLTWEKELLGLYITSHPLEAFKSIFEKGVLPIAKIYEMIFAKKELTDFSSKSNERIKIGGVIASIKKIITKAGKPMFFMKAEDLTSKIEVVIFPKMVEQNPDIFKENKIVLIKGRVDQRDGTPKIICEEIEEIIEEDQ
ncbi:MAG: DNA polymerase III subunit alpha [Candidatus Pacebacteria bacterium]|nr:DNA polymerase III subunit alpha [Candidatus Paceibacterota bacterium]